MLQLQSPNNVYPAAMDAPVSMALSTLQLWMLQCQWHGRHCSYGCSSVSGMVNPAAMDAPVSVAWSTLQLWMLQCQWHGQPCSYGCSSVSGMVNPAAMDVPVSAAWSRLQLWMLQCQWHGQHCSYGCPSVNVNKWGLHGNKIIYWSQWTKMHSDSFRFIEIYSYKLSNLKYESHLSRK